VCLLMFSKHFFLTNIGKYSKKLDYFGYSDFCKTGHGPFSNQFAS